MLNSTFLEIQDHKNYKKGQKLTLPKPIGSSDSLILAYWINKAKQTSDECFGCKRLILCDSQQTAQRITEEISFFSPEKN